jgi:phosphatidylinositol phospholipase C delta
MQLNEALFTGTDGYVLKPTYLRNVGGKRPEGKRKLRLHVAGATAVPIPKDRPQDGSDIKPYLTCTLVDPSHETLDADPPKKKTKPYRQHHLTGALHHANPPNVDPIWSDVLEWEYEASELAFLRMLVKSDDAFAANPKLAVAAVRLAYVVTGEWVSIRMLSLAGRATGCTLVVRFELE